MTCILKISNIIKLEKGCAEMKKVFIALCLLVAAQSFSMEKQENFDDINAILSKGNTRLINAINRCDLSGVAYYLQQGADPNKPDRNGMTPLDNAVTRPGLEYAELVLRYGANPDGSGTRQTPLMLAASLNKADSVDLLLKYNADIFLQDEEGKNVFNYAQGKQEILKRLKESAQYKEYMAEVQKNIEAKMSDPNINFDPIDNVEEYLFGGEEERKAQGDADKMSDK